MNRQSIIKVVWTVLLFFVSIPSAGSQNLTPKDDSLYRRMVKAFRDQEDHASSWIWKDNKWIISNDGISAVSFDSLFKPIFAKVMLNDANLVSQGSAYAFSVDQLKSTFSLNYSRMRDKRQVRGYYYNFGFSATSSSKTLPVFAKGEWQQGFSLNAGITHSFRNILAYNIPQDFGVRKNRVVMLSLRDLYTNLAKDTGALAASLAQLDSYKFHQLSDPKNQADLDAAIAALGGGNNKDLVSAEAMLLYLRKLRSMDAVQSRQYVDSVVSVFERSYLKNVHYKFWWWNVVVRPEYKGIDIYDTAAAKIAGIQHKDYFRIGLEGYLNYARNMNNLFIAQGGVSFKNSNYLEGRKPGDVAFLQNKVNDTVAITDASKAIIAGNYDQYKKQFLLFSPVIGFDWFWSAQRSFGWETFASAKIGFRSKEIPFDNLFTVRTGLLFSLNGKDDLAKSTFALLAQWEDVKFGSAALADGFTFSIRIGIPFNL